MIPELSFKMAYRHVRANFGRMALSIVAIALGVGLVVAFQLMNAAVLQSFLDTVDAMAGRAQLTVSAGEGLTFSEEVVRTVAAVPGVKLAVPLVRSVAFPDDGSGEMLTVHGVDVTNEAAVRLYHDAERSNDVIDDMVEFLNAPDAIIVGREFADRRGLKRGSTVNLVTPTGVRTFTIKGLLEPQGLARTLRGRLVVMDLYAAERAFTADGQINQIDVLVANGHDVAATRGAVARELPPSLAVEEPTLRRNVVRKTVAGFQAMITAFSLLAVVAGFVICYSRLSAIFEARTWEIGLFRAVGMSQTCVLVELLKEGLVLGVCGTTLGMAVGAVVARYGLPFIAATTAIALKLPPPSTETALGGQAFAFGAVVGILAAVGAAIAPAVRLARTQPVAALTMRGREMPRVTAAIQWRVRLAVLVLIIGLVAWQQRVHIPLIGHVTTSFIVIATCALAAPIVEFGGRILAAILPPAFTTAKTGVRHLARQPGRSTLTVATLGVGFGTVFLFGLLGWSFERTLVARLAGRLRADFVITSSLIGEGSRETPLKDSVLDELRGIHGVALVAGEQQNQVQSGSGVVTVNAFDATSFRDQRLFEWQVEAGALPDALHLVQSGDAVMISSSFAYEYEKQPGDLIEFSAPTGRLALQVAAVARGFPESTVVISRERYRTAWDDTSVWLVHLALEEGASRASVEAEIEKRLGTRFRLRIRSTSELIDYYAGLVHQAFSALYLCEAVIFLLVAVAIGDTLASGVLERTSEFGMMRALGLSRGGLFNMVMLEGATIGLLGLILAGAAGLVLSVFWVEVQFPAVLGFKLDYHFPGEFALGAAGLTMLLCLVGSFLPSLRAIRLSVPEALRNE